MSTTGLHRAVDKMRSAGIPELAIEVFGHYYAQLEQGRTGLIPEDSIEPVLDVTDISHRKGYRRRPTQLAVIGKSGCSASERA